MRPDGDGGVTAVGPFGWTRRWGAVYLTASCKTEPRPMKFLLRLLTWWNGQTLGTQFYTSRKGVRVGEDDQGNVFYQTADGARRWVT